jgi:hypothetical protein
LAFRGNVRSSSSGSRNLSFFYSWILKVEAMERVDGRMNEWMGRWKSGRKKERG